MMSFGTTVAVVTVNTDSVDLAGIFFTRKDDDFILVTPTHVLVLNMDFLDIEPNEVKIVDNNTKVMRVVSATKKMDKIHIVENVGDNSYSTVIERGELSGLV